MTYHDNALLETLGRNVDRLVREISYPGSSVTSEDVELARRQYDEALAKATAAAEQADA